MTPERTRQAVVLVVLATACFGALDTLAKLASGVAPLVMVLWCRYLFQAFATGLVLGPRRGRAFLHTRHPWLQALRGMLLVLSSSLAFISLRALPLAEFTALMMLAPLLITVVAARAMGERVSPLRWALLGGGFAGALLVIRPGAEDFNRAMLLPLAVVACNAAFQLLTSRLAKVDDAGTLHFYTGCVGAGIGTLLLPFTWQALPHAGWWAVLLALAAFSTLGHFLLIQAYGRAPANALTPYLYFQIAFGTLAGWLVWREAPDALAVLGMVMIAGFGIAGTWADGREALARQRAEATR